MPLEINTAFYIQVDSTCNQECIVSRKRKGFPAVLYPLCPSDATKSGGVTSCTSKKWHTHTYIRGTMTSVHCPRVGSTKEVAFSEQ